MSNYGRDQIWDAETWAEIDAAVLEQVRRVRVAQRVFPTHDLAAADGTAPSWISSAAVERPEVSGFKTLRIPENAADPFLEISVPFQLTAAQAQAEKSQHVGRTLARMAAKSLAMAEDRLIFLGTGSEVDDLGAQTNAATIDKRAGVASRLLGKLLPDDIANADELLPRVTEGIGKLASDGWPPPYALIVGSNLYEKAMTWLPASHETTLERLKKSVSQVELSGVLNKDQGVLVSLAGDPTTIYLSRDATTAFTGENLQVDGAFFE